MRIYIIAFWNTEISILLLVGKICCLISPSLDKSLHSHPLSVSVSIFVITARVRSTVLVLICHGRYASCWSHRRNFLFDMLVWNIYYDYDYDFFFGGHKSFLWGHWYPCFGLLVISALGFKARVDPLACFVACVILRFTSGSTPADCIEVSMTAEPFWSTRLQTCPKYWWRFGLWQTYFWNERPIMYSANSFKQTSVPNNSTRLKRTI